MKPEFRTSSRDETTVRGTIWSMVPMICLFIYMGVSDVLMEPNKGNILAYPGFYAAIVGCLIAVLSARDPGVIAKVYKDRLELGFGLLFKRSVKINSSEIKAINTTEYQANFYFPVGIYIFPIYKSIKGWIGYVWTNEAKGIMVETDEINYMFSSPDADTVAEKMRQLYGVSKGSIEPPPLKLPRGVVENPKHQ